MSLKKMRFKEFRGDALFCLDQERGVCVEVFPEGVEGRGMVFGMVDFQSCFRDMDGDKINEIRIKMMNRIPCERVKFGEKVVVEFDGDDCWVYGNGVGRWGVDRRVVEAVLEEV